MNFKKWDWCLVLELLQLLLLVIGVQGYPKQMKNVMTGSNVTLLPPRKHLGNYKRLTWLYTTKQKILEHENKTKYFNSTFKNRVKLDLESGALHIYEVWRRDSGVYYLRVYNEREEEWAINLTVWDPVPKPFITFKKKEESKDSCYLSLYCEIEDQTADYVWYNDSGPFPNENQADVLELTVNPQNYSTFYTCQVRNPVSSKNDTVYFTPPCGLARSSGVTWIATWLVALAPIMLCSLLI